MSGISLRVVCIHVLPWILFCGVTALNDRPIIGVLLQESKAGSPGDTYVHVSYVSYLEMAGARVIPIRIKESVAYYKEMMSYVNGVLLPGGSVGLINSGYAKAGAIIYKQALQMNQAGDYFPLWGTCQGFELLVVLTAGSNVLRHCTDMDLSQPIHPLPGAQQSRMLRELPSELYAAMTRWNMTANFHNFCLSPKNFSASSALEDFFQPLSLNHDKKGNSFISMIEAYSYPIYASQWHPEKNAFDWDVTDKVNHSAQAVHMAQYFANFFVNEARKSKHRFTDIQSESRMLIENFPLVYDGAPTEQRNYYFNLSRKTPSSQHTKTRSKHSSQPQHTYPRIQSPQDGGQRSPARRSGSNCDKGPGGINITAELVNKKAVILEDEHIFMLLGLGMVACLIVGLQLGRCLEAHAESEHWPDVLRWMALTQRPPGSAQYRRVRRDSGSNPGSYTGQRVRLLQQDKHYLTFETESAEDSDV